MPRTRQRSNIFLIVPCLLTETNPKPDNIHETIVFNILDIRQKKKKKKKGWWLVIPERQETHEVSLMMVPLLPRESTQASVQGKRTQMEPNNLCMLRRQSEAFRKSKAATFWGRLTERREFQKENTGDLQRDLWVFSWLLICSCMERTTKGHRKNTRRYQREHAQKSRRTRNSSGSHNPEWKTS